MERGKAPPAEQGAAAGLALARLTHELEVHQVELEAQNLELRAAHAEVVSALADHQALADNLPDLLASFDRDLRHRYVNQAAAAVGPAAAAAYVGRTLAETGIAPAIATVWEARLRHVFATGERTQFEDELPAPGGRRTYLTTLAPVRDAAGVITSVLSLSRDITDFVKAQQDRQRLHRSLAHADRLANLGMLAAGIAHEINNPLCFVLATLEGLVEELAQRAAPDAPRPADAAADTPSTFGELADRGREALASALRIREVARGLGRFARIERDRAAATDVRAPLEAALMLAAHEIKYRATVVRDYAAAPQVAASDGELAQVFLNLIVNAAHAIDEGDVDHNTIHLRIHSADAAVYVEVTDTGRGIAPADLPFIFDAFFTTKAPGKGTGLGLAISREIIHGLGGQLQCEPGPGTGTRFIVRLPALPTTA
ncbi:MAG: PAS domain-containing protein [Myxococcales bacterium]|nr:PAS domain-containing protein [Myxococcales bacterium]